MDILLVEDHRDIAENIADYCEAAGHELSLAMDGVTALRMVSQHRFDVMILDVMLPRMDGLSCLRQLRTGGHDLPVLMLTARDTLEDIVAGFDAGADDYLVKPFALPELLVRLQALHRRGAALGSAQQQIQQLSTPAQPTITIADLTIDSERHLVTRAGKVLNLNRTCFTVLHILARHAPKPVSRQVLEESLWGRDRPESDALRTHIYHLRQVVDQPFDLKLIETVRHVGIRLGPGA